MATWCLKCPDCNAHLKGRGVRLHAVHAGGGGGGGGGGGAAEATEEKKEEEKKEEEEEEDDVSAAPIPTALPLLACHIHAPSASNA